MAKFLTLLFAVFVCSQVIVEGKWKCSNCGIQYKAVGCYKDNGLRPLPYEILNERDVTSKVYGGRKIDWHDWDNYIEGFACRCAAMAKKKGYKVFGLQFYGECWSGPGLATYSNAGKAADKDCVGPQYKPCTKFTRHCVGKQFKNFVYEIVPDCEIPLENLGCYRDDKKKSGLPLPNYYLTDRDPTRTDIFSGRSIDWRNWDVYMPELVCRCAKKAKAMGRTTFGVQYYGECWTGEQGDVTYYQDGPSSKCINKCYESCMPYEKYCAGKQFTNKVYRLGDAPCEIKQEKIGCFKVTPNDLGTLLLDESDPTSKAFNGNILDITNWDAEFPKFLCRCAREAFKRGFSAFGVHDTAVCYGNHGSWSSNGISECPKNAGGEGSIFEYAVIKPSKIGKKSAILN